MCFYVLCIILLLSRGFIRAGAYTVTIYGKTVAVENDHSPGLAVHGKTFAVAAS